MEKTSEIGAKKDDEKVKKTGKKRKKPKKTAGYRGYQLVYQDNRLVEAKYDLTLQEKRLILFAMSRIKAEEFKVEPLVFQARELIDLCDLQGESGYSELKKTTAKLMSRVFVVRNLDKKTYTQLNWVTRSTYHEGEGTVEIKFNDDLGQFLLDLKKNFTTIPLAQTLGLSSVYAIRVYELLKQYSSIGKRYFDLETLREQLGVGKDKLKNFKDFRVYVLEIAQRELVLKTDLRFEFDMIKPSRRITGIEFFIYPNDPKQEAEKRERKARAQKVADELSQKGLKTDLLDLGFSLPTIRKFLKSFPEDQIRTALGVVLNQVEGGGVKNPKALFKAALEKGWK